MPGADFTYGGGGSSLTANTDPASAGSGGADYSQLFSAILADQYARKKKLQDLQDQVAQKELRSALAPPSVLGRPTEAPARMASRPTTRLGSPGDTSSFASDSMLRGLQQEAAMSALRPPPMKFVQPGTGGGLGFTPHYTMDVNAMNAAQRQAFLPQESVFPGSRR